MRPLNCSLLRRSIGDVPVCTRGRHAHRPGHDRDVDGVARRSRNRWRGGGAASLAQQGPEFTRRQGHFWNVSLIFLLVRLIVGAVFILAGMSKAVTGSSGDLPSVLSHLVSPVWMQPMLTGLVLVELLIGSLLLLGLAERWAAAGAGVLLAIFVETMLVVLVYGTTFYSHCGGTMLKKDLFCQTVSLADLGGDLLCLLLCLLLLLGSASSSWSLDRWLTRYTTKKAVFRATRPHRLARGTQAYSKGALPCGSSKRSPSRAGRHRGLLTSARGGTRWR